MMTGLMVGGVLRLPFSRVAVSEGAEAACAANGIEPADLLARHRAGDWGDVSEEWVAYNELALATGERLMSWYDVGGGVPVLACTMPGHAQTMLLVLADLAAAFAPQPARNHVHEEIPRA